jgi:hypothetical protein
MAGLVPAIHDIFSRTKNVDARDIGERRPSGGYAGHDEFVAEAASPESANTLA